MLPLENEHHMPPNEKPQLSSAEIALIQTWVEEGANFENRLASFRQVSKIKSYLSSVLDQSTRKSLIPLVEVDPAQEKAIAALTAKGIVVIPVGSETNYLSVSFINAKEAGDNDLSLLLPLKDQLLWLNVGRTKITDQGLKTIAQLTNLTQLNLEHTAIQDDGLKQLTSLAHLTTLNLVGNGISDAGLMNVARLPGLEKIYLYQTDVTSEGVSTVLRGNSKIDLDTGGYIIPRLATDTMVFKSKS
jgi:hypothetical protein